LVVILKRSANSTASDPGGSSRAPSTRLDEIRIVAHAHNAGTGLEILDPASDLNGRSSASV
jgi:hypothetical protein